MKPMTRFILVIISVIFAVRTVWAEPVLNQDKLKIGELNQGAAAVAESRIQAQNLAEQQQGAQGIDFDTVKVGDIDPISGGTVTEVKHESYAGNRDSVRILAVDPRTGREIIIQRWDLSSLPVEGMGVVTGEYVLDKQIGEPVSWTSQYFINGQVAFTEVTESPLSFKLVDPLDPESQLIPSFSKATRVQLFDGSGRLFRTVEMGNYQAENDVDRVGSSTVWSSRDISVWDGEGRLMEKRTEIWFDGTPNPARPFSSAVVAKRIIRYDADGKFTGSTLETYSFGEFSAVLGTNVKNFDTKGNLISEKNVKGDNKMGPWKIVSIAVNFGSSEGEYTDLNSDGITNILDLVTAAQQLQF